MFEAAGSLAIVTPTLTLVGLVALPLLWALVAAGSSRPALSVRTAVAGSALTLALAAYLAIRLALLPRGYVFVQHVAQLGRLGQLDLALDLAFDARSAIFAILVAVVALLSVVHSASGDEPRSELAWSGVITTGVMLVCVADSVPLILVGIGLASLGAWGLFHGRDPRASAVSFGGDAAILLGFVFLFWSLGGVFGAEGYDPDGAPRFVLVTTDAPSPDPEKATLAMTSFAGALVSADDGDLPNEPVAAPLSLSVSPGIYTLRIQRGAASGDVVVPRVALVAGRTHVLTPYGPTTSLRALDDQLAVPRPLPNAGTANVRVVLSSRTVGGLRASAVVLLLVLGGALGHVYALARRREASALASVLTALAAPYLALRLAPLVDPSGADGSLVVLLGVGSAFFLATRASSVDDAHAAVRGVLAATAAVGVAAAGLREPAAIVVLVTSATLAASASLASIDARRDARWLGVATSAATGVLPGAGASMGFVLAVTAALASASTGSTVWAIFAAALAIVLAATCTVISLASFRVYYAGTFDTTPRGTSRTRGAIAVVLSVLAILSGVALGAGTSMFGGRAVPFAERLVGTTVLAGTRSMAGAALALTVVASAAGAFLARRTFDDAPPAWFVALARPHAILSWTATAVAEGAAFLHRSVRAMEREVVEYVPSVLAAAVARGFGASAATVGRHAAQHVDDPVERATGAALAKLEMDDPRRAERVQTIVVLAMVAALAAIVLSSLFR